MKNLKSLLLPCLGLLLLSACSQSPPPPPAVPAAKTEPKPAAVAPTPAPAPVAETKAPAPAADEEVAVITTSEGVMVAEFWPDVAPKTVENFKTLAKKEFYDGTAFHRVLAGFMIQGGDPLTKNPAQESNWGGGDPGYKINAEFNDRPHVRGVLSMARANDPNSAGCQFFICHGNPTQLDHAYTTFGRLIKGDDVLEKIATTQTHEVRGDSPGHPSRPDKRMNIDSIRIVLRSTIK